MKPYLGKDATGAFNGAVYNHSMAARHVLKTLRMAKLAPGDPIESDVAAEDTQ